MRKEQNPAWGVSEERNRGTALQCQCLQERASDSGVTWLGLGKVAPFKRDVQIANVC